MESVASEAIKWWKRGTGKRGTKMHYWKTQEWPLWKANIHLSMFRRPIVCACLLSVCLAFCDQFLYALKLLKIYDFRTWQKLKELSTRMGACMSIWMILCRPNFVFLCCNVTHYRILAQCCSVETIQRFYVLLKNRGISLSASLP